MTRNLATVVRAYTMTCDDCGFSTRDQILMNRHSCSTVENGGTCEDYPCCGHERGDCNGLLYGSDEAIKAAEYDRLSQEEDGYGWYGDED